MNQDKYWKRTVIICGIGLSLFIFFVGFFAMFIFWLNDVQNPDIPGFFYYKAATYGDGICLPLLVGCMSMYLLLGYDNMKEYISRSKRVSVGIGLVCAAVGMVTQYSWLASDEIRFNWTIPRLHYFTPAGWYHAFYFTFMFGVIGFFLAEIWRFKSADKKKQNFEQSVCLLGVFAFGTGYMYLHAIDDWVQVYGRERAFEVTFIGMLLVLSAFIITADRNQRVWEDLKILFLSSCVTSGVVISIEAYKNIKLLYLLIAVVGMLLFSLWLRHKLRKILHKNWYYMVSIPAAFLMYLMLLSNYGIEIKSVVTILGITFLLQKCI